MIKQSILALARPSLSLSSPHSQVGHVIEHLLASPKRLVSIGIDEDFYSKNIIDYAGCIDPFYLGECYIVRSEIAEEILDKIYNHRRNLHTTKEEFEKELNIIKSELLGLKGDLIDPQDQLSRAILTPGSPSIKNPKHDIESLEGLTYEHLIEIFENNNAEIYTANLDFNNFKLSERPRIAKDKIIEGPAVFELTHPWKSPGIVDVSIIVPNPKNTDWLISLLYRRSLTEKRFGLLYDMIRTELGLVYDIQALNEGNSDTFELYFSCTEKNVDEIIKNIKEILSNYQGLISSSIERVKQRLALDLEIGWGDASANFLSYMDDVFIEGQIESDAQAIKRLNNISAKELIKHNNLILQSVRDQAITVKHGYGKKVSSNRIT